MDGPPHNIQLVQNVQEVSIAQLSTNERSELKVWRQKSSCYERSLMRARARLEELAGTTECWDREWSFVSREWQQSKIPHGNGKQLRTNVGMPDIKQGGMPALEVVMKEDSPAMEQIINAMLHQRTQRISKQQQRVRTVTIRTATSRLMQVYNNAWAKSTLRNRMSTYQRFHDWLRIHGRPMNDHNATLFLEATGVSVQGRHQYGKELMAIMNRQLMPTKRLAFYLVGLRAMGALVPKRQMAPLRKEQIRRLADKQTTLGARIAILLAWKTASRWDEVQHLTKESIVRNTPTEVIIDWGRGTKTTRQDPYRAAKYTVIVGDWTEEIHLGLKMKGDFEMLTAVTTEQIAKSIRQEYGKGFGAHSIKHGAMTQLVYHAALGELRTDQLEIIAKHKSKMEISRATVRYLQDRTAAARMLGTQEVTKWL